MSEFVANYPRYALELLGVCAIFGVTIGVLLAQIVAGRKKR